MKTNAEVHAQVKAYNRAIGAEAGKAILFFFVGIPALFFIAALAFTYGVKFIVPAALIAAGILWLIKRSKVAAA